MQAAKQADSAPGKFDAEQRPSMSVGGGTITVKLLWLLVTSSVFDGSLASFEVLLESSESVNSDPFP
jgi:hypothetical protein